MDPSVERALVPVWGRRAAIFLAVGLLAFALHPYLAGLDTHIRYVQWIAHEFATVHLAVIRSFPVSEHLHRLGGSLLVVAGLLQFSDGLRRTRPRLHRATGWVYVPLAVLAGLSGAFMAFTHPFGGALEVVPSVVFGGALVVVTLVALALARRRRFEAHREWMVRSFAIVLGPMTIRLVYPPFWLLLGVPERQTIWITFWIGWLVNVAVAEAWIRARRRRLAAARAPRIGLSGPGPAVRRAAGRGRTTR